MSNTRIAWLSPGDPPDAFPALENALGEPDGLLAAGGDLSSERLLFAYSHGIFPWYDEGQPILWWSPEPRCVLRTDNFRLTRRLGRKLAQSSAELRFNTAFSEVISACAGPRRSEQGTWITPDMMLAYQKLHAEGWAHSVEIWDDGALCGGLYGLAIGRLFFGESMFSKATDASKIVLAGLCQILSGHGFELIDCQVVSQHLVTLGAETVPRSEFAAALATACEPPIAFAGWPDSPLPVREIARK